MLAWVEATRQGQIADDVSASPDHPARSGGREASVPLTAIRSARYVRDRVLRKRRGRAVRRWDCAIAPWARNRNQKYRNRAHAASMGAKQEPGIPESRPCSPWKATRAHPPVLPGPARRRKNDHAHRTTSAERQICALRIYRSTKARSDTSRSERQIWRDCVRHRTTHGSHFGRHALCPNRWLPDQFGHVDEEFFGPYLACADTHHVVQPTVTGVVADVGQPADDLSCALRVSATIPTAVEQNRGAVVGRDRGVKVWTISPVSTAVRVIGSVQRATDPSVASTLSEEQVLTLSPLRAQGHAPSTGILEHHAIQRFKSHARSTTHARLSAVRSRFGSGRCVEAEQEPPRRSGAPRHDGCSRGAPRRQAGSTGRTQTPCCSASLRRSCCSRTPNRPSRWRSPRRRGTIHRSRSSTGSCPWRR